MSKLQYEKANITVASFLSFLQQQKYINAIIKFGSYAREKQDYHSDFDLIIWINNDFNKSIFLNQLREYFENDIAHVLNIPRKKSVCILSPVFRKIDLFIVNTLSELSRNYLGSMIPKELIDDSVISDNTGTVLSYLNELTNNPISQNNLYSVKNLIDYFLYNFETTSKSHAKSDGYQFYFNYNIALHALIQLNYLIKGNSKFIYNPKNVIYLSWKQEELNQFYDLKGTLFLPEANVQKRKLLNLFYQLIGLVYPEQTSIYKTLCERIYKRDYFWNFRDYATHTKNLVPQKLYRSATLSLFTDDEANDILKEKNIQTIIDLRAPREIEEFPYSKEFLINKNYIKAPFDPWNQSDWFKKSHQLSENRAIAYKFFLTACQSSFKKTVEQILNNTHAILIHCHAGKDRTGLFFGALQLLLGCSKEEIITDYMASGSDADLTLFNFLFEEVEKLGGIRQFFHHQGITELEQTQLIEKLRK